MEFRSIFIANPAYLSCQRRQLLIRQEGREASVPLEDISSVLLESQAITITTAALEALADNGATVYLCDRTHLPASVLLPMNQNCRQLQLLKRQMELSPVTKKQLWQSVVKAKIGNQAKCLELLGKPEAKDLQKLAQSVRSGDSGRSEGVAAAQYFRALFGSEFTRENLCLENMAMNYGYAILRGAMARTLVTSGVEPCLGIFHHSELNQFNLADDLMEPYRPIVDLFVATQVNGAFDLTPRIKQQLFNLTNYVISQDEKTFKVISAIGRTADSFARVLRKEATALSLPELLPLQEYEYV